ncbi:hypothetical protein NX801_10740 [Streptomyces sp. LP05-1]|uniref:Secreted protein n=1 Tax=Streptomyces pyxinae TaxID=2970734 RepID=A0ABT2CFD9_9ACTN|nr:hypothetical protein [Streptomyces sp. LP05-1]MCS0636129.1 hypothetical protein [Streptomyces sp. LP05-1]
MPPSALPDLAHTRARPVHWLATAAVMAGVVAGAALVQPAAATATRTAPPAAAKAPAATGNTPATGAVAPVAPDPAAVSYPLRCAGAGSVVARKTTGDLDGDGAPETVVAAHCDAGSGTPPSGVYVLTRDRGGAPRLVATLVRPEERLSTGSLTVRDGAVTATLLGYSSAGVPRCCPDREERAEWRWRGGKFIRSSTPAAGL